MTLQLLHALTTQSPSQWLHLFLLILARLSLGKGGWACLLLLKGRESFNILFCILLPQITLSNLRLAGNLEILIVIRRISIAKGEGALGHILCSGRGSKESVAMLWTQTKSGTFLSGFEKQAGTTSSLYFFLFLPPSCAEALLPQAPQWTHFPLAESFLRTRKTPCLASDLEVLGASDDRTQSLQTWGPQCLQSTARGLGHAYILECVEVDCTQGICSF